MAEIELDSDQDRAVDLMMEAPVSIVTGGPGVGKTTTMQAAVNELEARKISYSLCAPTGKAARRLSETTGRPASTIHRLLEWSQGEFTRHSGNPLDAQMVVVDESSMVDIHLASWLLNAVNRSRTRVCFVGDKDQLPPVGPGAFFRDIIESKVFPTVWLRTLHRAAQESWICRNAPKVLAGRGVELEDVDDFEWHQLDPRMDAAAIGDVCLNIVQTELRDRTLVERHPGGARHKRAVELDDIQVLTPMKKRKGGTVPLNGLLQMQLNASKDKGYKIFDEVIRPGDRVMQTVNNYDLNVFNGEVGTVNNINPDSVVVNFSGALVAYKHGDARALQLAYAATIHKSQGSQWPIVVVVCHSAHSFMLTRQLLYTALSRAQARVYIVGDERGIKRALATDKDTRRRTLLQQRLHGEI